uniref:GST N-terminal domain-containing protein n=1 Tax=Arcella intermedia TaxID=1963864 RepID=A0A6B2LHG8_9EUKA
MNYKEVQFNFYGIDLWNKPFWFELMYANSQGRDTTSLNTRSKVPLFQWKDDIIAESDNIINFIETHFPGPSLLPTTLSAPLKSETLLFIQSTLKAISPFKLLGAPEGERRSALHQELTQAYEHLEQHLRARPPGPFYLGDSFSLVEAMLFPYLERAVVVLGHFRGFQIPQRCPLLSSWFSTMASYPPIQKTRQDPQILINAYAKFAPK